MEPEMKKAWIVAGVKLVVGLFLLVTVMGIRVLTAPGGSIKSEVAELEPSQSALAHAASPAESGNASPGTDGTESSAERRPSASLSQRGASDGEADPNRMVACQLGGGRQFMSGGDCAMRGGRATDI